jgi:hypothetical protein
MKDEWPAGQPVQNNNDEKDGMVLYSGYQFAIEASASLQVNQMEFYLTWSRKYPPA